MDHFENRFSDEIHVRRFLANLSRFIDNREMFDVITMLLYCFFFYYWTFLLRLTIIDHVCLYEFAEFTALRSQFCFEGDVGRIFSNTCRFKAQRARQIKLQSVFTNLSGPLLCV